MMLNRNLHKEKRLRLIRLFEDFNKDISDDLIDVFKKIRNKIGIKTGYFRMELNLNDVDFTDLILDIDVKFSKIIDKKQYLDKDIIYYSNININDLILNNDRTYLEIIIEDVSLNMDKLYSIISHEIRHIYDFYTISEESDFNSFVKSLYYTKLKGIVGYDFRNFLSLVYLSLEHELVTRNTMIYENFINSKCSKEKLYEEFTKTYMYKSLIDLKNFNKDNFINLKYKDDINLFIGKFAGFYECESIEDIRNFFNSWDVYFKEKSDEWLKESYKILDKVYHVIKENYEQKPVRNVKDILLEIERKYILK